MARFAAGDRIGAERDFWPALNCAAPEDREDLLLEACEIAHALASGRSEVTADAAFIGRLTAEIAKSE